RYRKLSAQGKNNPQVITTLGRELLGFHLGHRFQDRASANGKLLIRLRSSYSVTDQRHTEPFCPAGKRGVRVFRESGFSRPRNPGAEIQRLVHDHRLTEDLIGVATPQVYLSHRWAAY